jgi:hypothetical protein
MSISSPVSLSEAGRIAGDDDQQSCRLVAESKETSCLSCSSFLRFAHLHVNSTHIFLYQPLIPPYFTLSSRLRET